VLLNVVALNADWWRLRSEGQAVEDDIAASYRRAFPAEPPPAQPLAQMRQKVAAMRQAAGEFAAGDFLTLSAALGEAWSEAGNDKRAIAGLDYRDATLSVRLRPGAQVSLEAMAVPLAARRLSVTPSPSDPSLWQVKSAP
jgi:general secretion pathway protein L